MHESLHSIFWNTEITVAIMKNAFQEIPCGDDILKKQKLKR